MNEEAKTAADMAQRVAELGQQKPVAHLCRYRSGEEFASLARQPLIDKDVESSLPLYARPVPTIPEGWKLAPVNPTREQLVAGGTAAREYMEETGRNNPAIIYTAMIAAAPEHKA